MAKRLSSEASASPMQPGQNPGLTQCTCGNVLPDDAVRCPVCLEPGRKHPSRQIYSLPTHPARHMTPPPIESASPRQSLDQSERPSAYVRPRASYTANALSNSFAADEGGSAFFPPSLYARNSSLDSSRRSSTSLSTFPDGGESRRTSSVTPSRTSTLSPGAVPSPGLNDSLVGAEYAPMAGAFTRLRSRDSTSSDAGRRGRARPSTDLAARMFAGAP